MDDLVYVLYLLFLNYYSQWFEHFNKEDFYPAKIGDSNQALAEKAILGDRGFSIFSGYAVRVVVSFSLINGGIVVFCDRNDAMDDRLGFIALED